MRVCIIFSALSSLVNIHQSTESHRQLFETFDTKIERSPRSSRVLSRLQQAQQYPDDDDDDDDDDDADADELVEESYEYHNSSGDDASAAGDDDDVIAAAASNTNQGWGAGNPDDVADDSGDEGFTTSVDHIQQRKSASLVPSQQQRQYR